MVLRKSGGLHRALTWRYVLVTTGALLVVELLVLLVLVRFAPPYTFGMQPDVHLIRHFAETARAYLLADDIAGLDAWLDDLHQPVVNVTFDENWLRMNLATFPLRDQQTVMVFREGDGVLAITPHGSPLENMQQIEDLPGPLNSGILRSVPEKPGNNILITQSGSHVLSIFPIQDEDGALLGLFILVNLAPEYPPSAADIIALAGTSTLVLVGITAILGGGFGFLASRFVTRRLNLLVTTTARWGVGDFSQPVCDGTTEDEITALARHLNHLRMQIQDLLIMREHLAVLEEQSRFARELHDSVKQQVFTLRMNLATIDAMVSQGSNDAQPYLQKTISLAQTIQDELTLMISMFRDRSLPSTPLAERLRQFVMDWSHQTGIRVEFDAEAAPDADLWVSHAVYRVTQEALANVYRHSGADKVSVWLAAVGETLRMQMTDNGSGFDPAHVKPGVGLLSMRERIEALGGTLTVHSDNTGTTLQAQIPLEVTQS